jgi:hypothetical protein
LLSFLHTASCVVGITLDALRSISGRLTALPSGMAGVELEIVSYVFVDAALATYERIESGCDSAAIA